MFLEKFNVKEFSEQLGIIDRLGKHFLIERMAFLSMPNICFRDAQIS